MNEISYYQNITDDPNEDPLRKNSAYWNLGKWNNYIKPLLPTENRKDMTFIDIGANNGLFCKLAKDDGFRNVIGVEADKGAVERGIEWRDKLGYDYKLLNRSIGVDYKFDELPLADVFLLSNVHYYFKLKDWYNFLDILPTRTEYCLIITRPFQKRLDWQPLVSIEAIKHYFRDWELVKAKYRVRQRHMEFKGDPKPRVLHAMLFRSRLRRRRFEDLIPVSTADEIKIDRSELLREISEGKEIRETSYYKAWMDRMYPKRWTEDEVYNFVKEKAELDENIKKDGVKEPIIVSANLKTIDGKHRIEILKNLGYESIITRMI